jgi:tetratricopeptide (TPR) repeat protein
MRSLLPVLLLLSLSTGCTSMMDYVDSGRAHEKEARDLQRDGNYAEAIPGYAAASVDYQQGLEIAEDKERVVFVSFINTKLAIVTHGEGVCTLPSNNPAGEWERARGLFDQAAKYAREVSMLRLMRNARFMEAFASRPDQAPDGEWKRAHDLYAEAARLAKDYENDEERAEALREQAVCLLEGKLEQLTPEARKLLVEARTLGDTRSAELLGADKGRFCRGCGGALESEARFCPNCGQDQAEPEKPQEPDPETPRRRMGPGQGPGGPGGPGSG